MATLGTAFGPSAAAAQATGDDPSPHSNIELISEYRTVRPGDRITLALRVTLDPGWHTYWKNGGDAGLPINASWTVPGGVRVGAIRFPTPSLMPEAPLMTYGYTNEVVYLLDVDLPASLPVAQRIRLETSADWLACADVCLPAAGNVAITFGVTSGSAERDPRWAGVIAAAQQRMPRDGAAFSARGWPTADGYTLAIATPGALKDAAPLPYFFIDTLGVLDHAKAQRVARSGDTLFIAVAKSPFADSTASILNGVLATDATRQASAAFALTIPITTARAAGSVAARAALLLEAPDAFETGGVSGAALTATTASAGAAAAQAGDNGGWQNVKPSDPGIMLALLFAFIGGLILNLMPCVFPVLSVKVLGFVEHGGGDPGVGRKHGLVFAAGVLVTFWALAGTLLAIRAGGATLGWGFQMQSPPVVALLALTMFGLALNLSGVFEIGMSLTRLGGAGSGRSYTDSFLTGALAVIVATPCTAPFMGAALGFALTQPPIAAMLVFTALAVGLALPYVVLAAVPALLRFLPRPGPWLETFKQALAFPLYATVVWLLWVFGQQQDMNTLALLMLALTLFAFGAWVWGRAAHSQRSFAKVIGVAAMLGAVAMSVAGGLAPSGRTPSVVASTAPGVHWETYTPARLAELREAGRPVLIDFTAAWCLSCQVNERVALKDDGVHRAFADADIALLRADWTSRDAEIAAVLATYGRSGIPLYVLYGAGKQATPELLPAVLTPGIVIDAVKRASKAKRTAAR